MRENNKPHTAKILAIDTSLAACSVALGTHHHLTHDCKLTTARQHNAFLLPMIAQQLAEHAISLRELDALAFTRGPGSFTGLRMAMSAIQALAVTAQLPVITVSSLQAMAQTVYHLFQASPVIIANDANINASYIGLYHCDDSGMMQPLCPDYLMPFGDVMPRETFKHMPYKQWVSAGSTWQRHEKRLRTAFCRTWHIENVHSVMFPDIRDVIKLAYVAWSKGNTQAISEVELNYLYEANAWKPAVKKK